MTDDMILKVCLYGIAVIIFILADRYIKRKADEKRENFFRRLYAAVVNPVKLIFFITFVYAVLQQGDFGENEFFWVHKAYTISLIACVGWLLTNIVKFSSDRFLRKFDVSVADNLGARSVHTQVNVIRRLVVAIIIIIAVAAILMTFEQIRSLGVSLLASAGVAGIVIGLAAQKTIGNFFTGIQIAITQPIRLGDFVVVEGEWGWIEEINLTYVVVKLWDLRRLVLPISYFVEKPFQNWTRTTAEIIGTVLLYVDYRMPIEPIRQELDRILDNNERWNGSVKVVQVTDSKEKSMEIRLLVSARNAPTAWDLRCEVREKMIQFIQTYFIDCLPKVRAEISSGVQGDFYEANSTRNS